MPRNFGVRRPYFGEQLLHDYWHDNDNEPAASWPYLVIGAAVVAMIAIGIFA